MHAPEVSSWSFLTAPEHEAKSGQPETQEQGRPARLDPGLQCAPPQRELLGDQGNERERRQEVSLDPAPRNEKEGQRLEQTRCMWDARQGCKQPSFRRPPPDKRQKQDPAAGAQQRSDMVARRKGPSPGERP